jgi:hypothetical protein
LLGVSGRHRQEEQQRPSTMNGCTHVRKSYQLA